jgi:hypothetical protein
VLEGSYVFVDDSGWYIVNATDGAGALFLQLIQALPGAAATIPAGKLVVPSGIPGSSLVGPAGATGAQGPQGPSGATTTSSNGSLQGSGSQFVVPASYAPVIFPAGPTMRVLLPTAGTYLVTATVTYVGQGAVASTDANNLLIKLRNTTSITDVNGSEQDVNFIVLDAKRVLNITAIAVTASDNQYVSLYAEAYAANVVYIGSGHTYMNYVRLA